MDIQNITTDEILDLAFRLHKEHYRLIQICATRLNESIVVDYTFGRVLDRLVEEMTEKSDTVAS